MKQRIFDICEHLAAQGIKPTLIRVRTELGGGSFSTINPLLQQWKEEKKKKGDNQTIELRNEIATIHQKTTALIWDTMSEYYQNMKREQEEELIALRKEVARADELISTLHRKLEETEQEKTILERLLIKK
jgi:hypothetical protein